MSTTPEPTPTPAAAHGPTGDAEAARRDAELADREVAAELRAAAEARTDPDDAARAAAEARGLDAQRESEELDRQAEAAVDALNRGAPD